MSNLGWYQKIVEMAKLVDGPKNLIAILLGSGAIIGATASAGAILGGQKLLKKHKNGKKCNISGNKLYDICKEAIYDNLHFMRGDKYKVLAVDNDAVLIEKINDANNPYFVSSDFLKSISNYPHN